MAQATLTLPAPPRRAPPDPEASAALKAAPPSQQQQEAEAPLDKAVVESKGTKFRSAFRLLLQNGF